MPEVPFSAYLSSYVAVVTITDRAKAGAWLASMPDVASLTKSTYRSADLYTAPASPETGGTPLAIGLTDKVLIGGSEAAVKAAVDTNGTGTLGQDADLKAAFASVDHDYVVLGLSKFRPLFDAMFKAMPAARPVLEGTQIDETLIAMFPAWEAGTYRFENDALVMSSTSPAAAIGYDATNRKSALLDHVPSNTLLYADMHDVGPALTALVGKFRALPETKSAFQTFDQALNVLGGWDAVFGWWGDTAFAIAPGPGGTIGGGLLIHPRDEAAAQRLLTTFQGYLALAGGSSGINVREEDHNGTKIVIIDLSAAPGMNAAALPAGYKAEFAYAVNADVAVLGYGRDFVASVLDARPGSSLSSNDRFKALLGRVGDENIGLWFVDLNAIRTMIEPIVQQAAQGNDWTSYVTQLKPYLEHIDAMVASIRKDGGTDRTQAILTTR
jgi:hypothetical protein